MLGPDREQGNAVIHFGGLEKTAPGCRTFAVLAELERSQMVARRRPELPSDHACGMPGGIPIGLLVAPRGAVPPQPVDRLPADAEMAGPAREARLPERGRWKAERHR